MKNVILVIIVFLFASGMLADGAKYLIITHDNFYDAIQPLAQWKHKKGIPTKVVRLSEIGALPESIARIKNYIVNAYNTWNPRPEYVLLVGSPDYIRSYQNAFDDYYADMAGNYLMELSVGRFSVSNPSQCSVVVAKTLGYEQTPFLADTTWFKKGMAIIREQINPPIDSLYWNSARYCAELMRGTGFVHIDTFSRNQGDSARHIEQAITDGRTYVVYQGIGIVTWWVPFSVDTARINNGFKLPVVISACSPTVNLYDTSPYLGENLQRAGNLQNPKGSIGFWGTTQSGENYEISRVTAAKGFFRSVFLDGVYNLGDAAKRAKFILDSIHPPYYNTTRYREWNLLGDPELNLWTAVPKPLTVTYDSIIHPTPTNITITVTSNGTPIPNALICLMKDTTIYEYGYSDSNGTRVFSISPQDTCSISITVTARNCHPFEGIISVLSTGVEEIASHSLAMTLGAKVYPNPVKALSVIRYMLPTEGKVLLQLYDISGRLVKTLVDENKNPGNYELTLNTKNLSAGVYFLSLETEEKRIIERLIIIK